MTEVVIREATLEDAIIIGRIDALAEKVNSLIGYMTMSDRTYVGTADDKIVCIWGVMRQSLLSDRGYLWLLTTEAAEDHKFLLIRYSQRIIETLLQRYAVLTGECQIGDARARKWMRFLGAEFSFPEGKTIPFQITGVKWQTR